MARLAVADNIYVGQTNHIELPKGILSLESLANSQYTFASDVWSFGILMAHTLDYGRPDNPGFIKLYPYFVRSTEDTATNDREVAHLDQGYRPQLPSSDFIPDEIKIVIYRCWLRDWANDKKGETSTNRVNDYNNYPKIKANLRDPKEFQAMYEKEVPRVRIEEIIKIFTQLRSLDDEGFKQYVSFCGLVSSPKLTCQSLVNPVVFEKTGKK